MKYLIFTHGTFIPCCSGHCGFGLFLWLRLFEFGLVNWDLRIEMLLLRCGLSLRIQLLGCGWQGTNARASAGTFTDRVGCRLVAAGAQLDLSGNEVGELLKPLNDSGGQKELVENR